MQTLQTLAGGRFSLHALLGEGGMAQVYRAYDHRLKRWRAVKRLLPEFVRRRRVRQRFEAEAQALARLEHPNVVRIYDVGSTGEESWIIMELCEGGSLEEWLQHHGPMPPRMAVRVLLAVCDGIQAAHGEGILHRDIKPHNVLIDGKGVPKVTDFGIAHFETSELTRTGAAMGTDGYMAPEQRENAKSVGPTADIYSLGATLFTLVTDRIDPHLFAADREPGKLAGLPDALAAIVARCTAYHPDDRYASIPALRQALASVLPALPLDAEGTPGLLWRPIEPLDAPSPPPTLIPGTDVGPSDVETMDPDPLTFVAPPTAPEPLFSETPETPIRTATPTPSAVRRRIERVNLGGFEVIYEEPVEERVDEIRWTAAGGRSVEADRPDRRPPETGADAMPPPGGAGWAVRESWGFFTQILTAMVKALGNPVGFVFPGVMALTLLLVVGMVAEGFRGRVLLSEAHDAWRADVERFHHALDADRALRGELVARGANARRIDAAVAWYEAAGTLQDKQEAAEALASLLAAELAVLETRGDLDLRDQRALKRRMRDIQEKRRAIDASEARWEEVSASMAGRVASGCGGGARPPADGE